MIVLLPGPLGDACRALHLLEPAWPSIAIAQPCTPIVRKVLALLGLPISSKPADAPLTRDWGWTDIVTPASVVAAVGTGHAWTRPALGSGVALCCHASNPAKEWPHWGAIVDMGEAVPRTAPDLIGAILRAHTVVANHSGPAHLGALLGRRVVCIHRRRMRAYDPIGADMVGAEGAWPSVAEVRAAVLGASPL